jgi:hypothetical protein
VRNLLLPVFEFVGAGFSPARPIRAVAVVGADGRYRPARSIRAVAVVGADGRYRPARSIAPFAIVGVDGCYQPAPSIRAVAVVGADRWLSARAHSPTRAAPVAEPDGDRCTAASHNAAADAP